MVSGEDIEFRSFMRLLCDLQAISDPLCALIFVVGLILCRPLYRDGI